MSTARDADRARVLLADMHCHLDRMTNATQVARDAAGRGIAIFDVTVTPADAERTRGDWNAAAHPNVRTGVGLHPWWIADGRCSKSDARRAAELAATSPYVGEIGLDFGRRGTGPDGPVSHARQLEVFEGIVAAIAAKPLPHRLLSLHAVRAAGTVLDLLEEHRLIGEKAPAGTACILHWFSGTSDELARARKLGCYFSVSEHMLASKRGREYARQLPVERLLLETDAPPGLDAPYSAQQIETSLRSALHTIAGLRRNDPADLGARIAATSARLLEL